MEEKLYRSGGVYDVTSRSSLSLYHCTACLVSAKMLEMLGLSDQDITVPVLLPGQPSHSHVINQIQPNCCSAMQSVSNYQEFGNI